MQSPTETPTSRAGGVLETVEQTLLASFGQEVESNTNINWEQKTQEFINALQKNGVYVTRREG